MIKATFDTHKSTVAFEKIRTKDDYYYITPYQIIKISKER